jgi:hypothetical protein
MEVTTQGLSRNRIETLPPGLSSIPLKWRREFQELPRQLLLTPYVLIHRKKSKGFLVVVMVDIYFLSEAVSTGENP